jgi:CheY-like chemotaxis protein
VLLNLVLNARDALPHGGKIAVSTRSAEFPLGRSDDSGPENVRRAIALVVTDNGCGMDAETRARLFEPFFTTKKLGKGTGLGLATVQRVVSESGGAIGVESNPGRGTTIEVLLPAIESPTGKRPESELPASQFIGKEHVENVSVEVPTVAPWPVQPAVAPIALQVSARTILLVADQAPTRKSMQRVLVDAGHRILAACSGQQALEIFAGHSHIPDLLIADCMMPGMSGNELAETLLQRKPDLKVLLISGYQDSDAASRPGAVEILRTPFSGRDLMAHVFALFHHNITKS